MNQRTVLWSPSLRKSWKEVHYFLHMGDWVYSAPKKILKEKLHFEELTSLTELNI